MTPATAVSSELYAALVSCCAFDLNAFGCAHVVIGDLNVDDYHLDDCIEECQHPDARQTDDEITVAFLKAMLKLGEDMRISIIEDGERMASRPFTPDEVLNRPWRTSVIARFLST